MADWITIVLKARWRIVEYALKTQKQENQKTGETSRAWARGARSRLEMPVDSVCWRGARAGWRRAQAESADPFLCRFCGKICFGKYLFWILFYFIR